ncbi:hypothetical protein NA57DRAFT_54290 [Rhizodiscina lignyota]|uniref:Secreted protein n=1 Tax=Rhizodiscina lignyota TaxID=1504668 RepID=A0A9P4IE79_9PEZI|nr:hypothetical protein NA57DRAFT_54290 [Rhizodiscina lignyota]
MFSFSFPVLFLPCLVLLLLSQAKAVPQASPPDPSGAFGCDAKPATVPPHWTDWLNNMQTEIGDTSTPAGSMISWMCSNPGGDPIYNCSSDGNTQNDCTHTVDTAFYTLSFHKTSSSGNYPACSVQTAVRPTPAYYLRMVKQNFGSGGYPNGCTVLEEIQSRCIDNGKPGGFWGSGDPTNVNQEFAELKFVTSQQRDANAQRDADFEGNGTLVLPSHAASK